MPMTPETIKALNYIIDAHNDGSSDQIRADKYKCHLAQIRSVLALVKKLGTTVKHQAHGHKYTADEKMVLAEAMKQAQARIAAMRNGHA